MNGLLFSFCNQICCNDSLELLSGMFLLHQRREFNPTTVLWNIDSLSNPFHTNCVWILFPVLFKADVLNSNFSFLPMLMPKSEDGKTAGPDLSMLRTFRVLRPLKLVSGVPSKYTIYLETIVIFSRNLVH